MSDYGNRLNLDDELHLVEQLRHHLPPEYAESTHPGLWPLVQITSARAAGGEVTASDAVGAMRLVMQVRRDVDEAEVRLIEAALDRGETFDSIGAACGLSETDVRHRYRQLGGTRDH